MSTVEEACCHLQAAAILVEKACRATDDTPPGLAFSNPWSEDECRRFQSTLQTSDPASATNACTCTPHDRKVVQPSGVHQVATHHETGAMHGDRRYKHGATS